MNSTRLEGRGSIGHDAPVTEAQRVEFWDVLRGFAVLGILLANIPWMALSGAIVDHTGNHVGGDHWLDLAELWFVRLFVDTKFVTTFSILFGAGLGLLSQKAIRRGTPFKRIHLRRLLVLLLVGIVHGALLWFGDILTFYALMGTVAMWFARLRVRTLLIWAGIFLGINWLFWIGFGFLDPLVLVELEEIDGRVLSAEESLAVQRETFSYVFSSGDTGLMLETRASIFAGFCVELLVFIGLRTLGLFLLGIALVKSGLFLRVADHRALFGRSALLGLGIGLPLQIGQMAADFGGDSTAHRVAGMTLLYVTGLSMSFGYIGLIALWSLTDVWNGLRFRLAAVGRMAFTNYLSQSLITTVIFCHLGEYDLWRRPELFVLALAIFGFQLWLSPLWLRHFRIGPLEWLWRMATYWQWIPLLRARKKAQLPG